MTTTLLIIGIILGAVCALLLVVLLLRSRHTSDAAMQETLRRIDTLLATLPPAE